MENAGEVDVVAYVKEFVAKEFTFYRFYLKAGAKDTSEHGADIVEMFKLGENKTLSRRRDTRARIGR